MSSKKKTAARKAGTPSKGRGAAKPAKAKKSAKPTKAAKLAKSTKPAKAKKPAARTTKKPKLGKAKAASARPSKARVATKKAAKSKTPAIKVAAATKKAAPMKRRDGAGHLDPKYAAELREKSGARENGEDRGFLRKSGTQDPLAEELGEEFVETITSGEDEGTELRDRKVVEELGGPFTVTSSGTEFARGIDGSNPKGATREPFPKS